MASQAWVVGFLHLLKACHVMPFLCCRIQSVEMPTQEGLERFVWRIRRPIARRQLVEPGAELRLKAWLWRLATDGTRGEEGV